MVSLDNSRYQILQPLRLMKEGHGVMTGLPDDSLPAVGSAWSLAHEGSVDSPRMLVTCLTFSVLCQVKQKAEEKTEYHLYTAGNGLLGSLWNGPESAWNTETDNLTIDGTVKLQSEIASYIDSVADFSSDQKEVCRESLKRAMQSGSGKYHFEGAEVKLQYHDDISAAQQGEWSSHLEDDDGAPPCVYDDILPGWPRKAEYVAGWPVKVTFSFQFKKDEL